MVDDSIPTDAYFYLELQWVFRAVPVRSFEIDPFVFDTALDGIVMVVT